LFPQASATGLSYYSANGLLHPLLQRDLLASALDPASRKSYFLLWLACQASTNCCNYLYPPSYRRFVPFLRISPAHQTLPLPFVRFPDSYRPFSSDLLTQKVLYFSELDTLHSFIRSILTPQHHRVILISKHATRQGPWRSC